MPSFSVTSLQVLTEALRRSSIAIVTEHEFDELRQVFEGTAAQLATHQIEYEEGQARHEIAGHEQETWGAVIFQDWKAQLQRMTHLERRLSGVVEDEMDERWELEEAAEAGAAALVREMETRQHWQTTRQEALAELMEKEVLPEQGRAPSALRPPAQGPGGTSVFVPCLWERHVRFRGMGQRAAPILLRQEESWFRYWGSGAGVGVGGILSLARACPLGTRYPPLPPAKGGPRVLVAGFS